MRKALVFVGLVVPALLVTIHFQEDLLARFTWIEAFGLCLALSFIYFSYTLIYIVVLGSEAVKNETESIYLALAITVASIGIDLAYSWVVHLSLVEFCIALILLYIFFIGCFVIARVCEIKR